MKKFTYSLLRKLTVFSVFIFASASLMAQTNFSGTWALNESKSNFGDSQFRFAATNMVITQNAGTISVESAMTGPDGEMKMSSKYNLDGTVSENTGMMDMKSKSTLTWSADKASAAIATTMIFDMNGESREMKSTQTWKLAEGGKVLMIETTRPGFNGGAETKTTAAYDKK